ncbi:hypothetical protein BDW67DRAFT_108859 [Aspergillus spinulosporus]
MSDSLDPIVGGIAKEITLMHQLSNTIRKASREAKMRGLRRVSRSWARMEMTSDNGFGTSSHSKSFSVDFQTATTHSRRDLP